MAAETVADRLADVRSRIARAAAAVGRDPGEIRLIGVSKGMGIDAIREAAAAGLSDFGENRVQEALEKMTALGSEGSNGCSWHLIGRLQTNKVRAAVGRFSLIQSVDSARLGHAIDEAAGRTGIVQRVLIQVNIGREAQKGGVDPSDLESLWRELTTCRHLRVEGLMAIPPAGDDPETARPYFRELRRLGDPLPAPTGDRRPLEYSMGMSHDFEAAVKEGATMVRVGTAIFGPRSLAGDRSLTAGNGG
ncbi:MAG TPA: YggS family pyridoxal phosphate-dependent enzyme [Nitrospiria bacterium]|nr:YggS family pyridoxal phosphate-dependent enzyme [Nitrospiria bacterium]